MVLDLQKRKRKREATPPFLSPCQLLLINSPSASSSSGDTEEPPITPSSDLVECKLPLGSMTDEVYDQETEDNFDSDYDDGEAVRARGWPRNHRNLAKHGFRSVWTSQGGYPGDEIPADIGEWLDENGQCKSVQMIGPLRSLAWLVGLDELVEAIDDPAYHIEDDIELIPFGKSLL
ncbi:unnamed protein product [Penicillium glandicola]